MKDKGRKAAIGLFLGVSVAIGSVGAAYAYYDAGTYGEGYTSAQTSSPYITWSVVTLCGPNGALKARGKAQISSWIAYGEIIYAGTDGNSYASLRANGTYYDRSWRCMAL